MHNLFRIAGPGEFTFKRDSAGVETVETRGLIFGRITSGRFEPVVLVVGDPDTIAVDADVLDAALDLARVAGFWSMGTPGPSTSPVSVTVAVASSSGPQTTLPSARMTTISSV